MALIGAVAGGVFLREHKSCQDELVRVSAALDNKSNTWSSPRRVHPSIQETHAPDSYPQDDCGVENQAPHNQISKLEPSEALSAAPGPLPEMYYMGHQVPGPGYQFQYPQDGPYEDPLLPPPDYGPYDNQPHGYGAFCGPQFWV